MPASHQDDSKARAGRPWRDDLDAIAVTMAEALRGQCDGWETVTARDIVVEDHSGVGGGKAYKLTNRASPEAQKSGPFGAMPILHWDGELVAETSVIADFLTEELDLHGRLSRSAARRSLMVRSAASEFGGGLAGLVIHSAGTAPGADAATLARLRLPWFVDGLRRLGGLVPGDAPFFGGAEPDLADFSALEMVDILIVVCGPAGCELLDALPALTSLCDRLSSRPRIVELRESGSVPERFTGRLDESNVLQELRDVDWSGSFA